MPRLPFPFENISIDFQRRIKKIKKNLQPEIYIRFSFYIRFENSLLP